MKKLLSLPELSSTFRCHQKILGFDQHGPLLIGTAFKWFNFKDAFMLAKSFSYHLSFISSSFDILFTIYRSLAATCIANWRCIEICHFRVMEPL